jgi:ATP-dependent DNA helicase Q1
MNRLRPGAACRLAGKMEHVETSTVYRAMGGTDTATETHRDRDRHGHGPEPSRMRLLYTTPEKIVKSKILMTHLQRAYERGELNSIVVDEAHCASQWGHDFRPDYAKLHILRTVFPTVPLLLLTATANSAVRSDVTEMLQLGVNPLALGQERPGSPSAGKGQGQGKGEIQGLKTFLGDFDRPNLAFEVWTKPPDFASCLELVRAAMPPAKAGNAIVYCFSQAECMQVSDALADTGVLAAPYHAGLADAYRDRVQDAWVGGEVQVICATIAFGLGINMPSVRVVVHFTISKSLELYYQEVCTVGVILHLVRFVRHIYNITSI